MDRCTENDAQHQKTKSMNFNFTDNFQFDTRLKNKDQNIDLIDSTKLLGTVISNDLKWDMNTKEIVKKANSRMQLLRKCASFGPSVGDLQEIYVLFVRSILEQSATVWHSSISVENSSDLERVQKSALRIILGDRYPGYQQGLIRLGMETLKSRREMLCLNFAKKCVKNDKLKHMFPENPEDQNMKTRKYEKYKVQFANTGRCQKSPIIYMQKLLNEDHLQNKIK